MWANYLPLALALALFATVPLAWASRRVDRLHGRAALQAFGPYVRERESAATRRKTQLRAAHVGSSYHGYAARTYLYAATVAVGASILGIYVIWAGFLVLGIPAATARAALPRALWPLASLLSVPRLSALQLFGLLLASNATLGVAAGLATYRLRWWFPRYVAGERRRQIDESMERTIAFVYALSRSGMAFPEVLGILSRNRGVYGAAADEVHVAVRDMELFGSDMLAALERVSRRTPSDQFEEFTENLVNVLRSGQSLPSFLRGQYEYYKEEAAAQQTQFLEMLATVAEAYVTILVAGPLFLITILVIIGLVLGGTLQFLRVFTYLLIPLASAGFVVYLDSLTQNVSLDAEEPTEPTERWRFADVRGPDGGLPDGGTVHEHNVGRLAAYNRLRGLRRRAGDPVRALADNPTFLLYVTVPLAGTVLLLRAWSLLSRGAFTVRAFDDDVVLATLFVVGSFAVVYELHTRRIRRIEAAVPDFLDRLASVNEAGMSVAASIRRVARSDLGALDRELDRIRVDIEWGARVETALLRFERRVDTGTVTRIVTLVTNSMHASGDVGPVLRIAADQAQSDRRLQRERRRELFTYLVVIYLSFFVFLAIIASLSLVFLPSVPTTDQLAGASPGGLVGISRAARSAYELVLFHTAIVQAVCSGFVAGQMGEGHVAAGAKHAAVMLVIAYVLVAVLA